MSLSVQNSFENALSQFQQLSDFDRCHEGSKQEDAEGWRLGAISQVTESETRRVFALSLLDFPACPVLKTMQS